MRGCSYVAVGLSLVVAPAIPAAGYYDIPGFREPFVVGDCLVAVGPSGDQLYGFGKTTGNVLWKVRAPSPNIRFVCGTSEGNVRVVTPTEGILIDARTGTVVDRRAVHCPAGSHIMHLESDWRAWLVDHSRRRSVRSVDLTTRAVFWTWTELVGNCAMDADYCAGHVLVNLSPYGSFTATSRPTAEECTEKTICLRASDGSLIWEETREMSYDLGGAASRKAAVLGQRMLCPSHNAVRLLDTATGRRLARWETAVDEVIGAAFWSLDRVVVCIGEAPYISKENTEIHVAVLALPALNEVRAFRLNLAPNAVVGVFGDTLVLHSMAHRTWGVDLTNGRLEWGPERMRDITVDKDRLFFSISRSIPPEHRAVDCMIGICEPITGTTHVLHRQEWPARQSASAPGAQP